MSLGNGSDEMWIPSSAVCVRMTASRILIRSSRTPTSADGRTWSKATSLSSSVRLFDGPRRTVITCLLPLDLDRRRESHHAEFARSAQLDLRHTTFVSRRKQCVADYDEPVTGSRCSAATRLPLHDIGGRVSSVQAGKWNRRPLTR